MEREILVIILLLSAILCILVGMVIVGMSDENFIILMAIIYIGIPVAAVGLAIYLAIDRMTKGEINNFMDNGGVYILGTLAMCCYFIAIKINPIKKRRR